MKFTGPATHGTVEIRHDLMTHSPPPGISNDSRRHPRDTGSRASWRRWLSSCFARLGVACHSEHVHRFRLPLGTVLLSLCLAVPVFATEDDLGFLTSPPVAAATDEPQEGTDEPQNDPVPPSPASRRVIEEVVVTAQRREQSLRDVPISLTVVDSEFIADANISDFRELSYFVPNVSINNQPMFEDIRIRGLGTALNNKAFEQSVGIVVDGAAYGRTPYFLGPMFDIERVEVLRGPQGTLFGKNTTGGLVSVTTRRPTDDLAASLAFEYGEFDRVRAEPAVGGPLVPGLLNVRVAALYEDRGPLMKNTTGRIRENVLDDLMARERKAVRGILAFPDLLGADLTLSYEHSEFETLGAGWETQSTIPAHVSLFRDYDPRYTPKRNDFVTSNDGAVNSPDFMRNTIDSVVANVGYDLWGWTLEGHGSWSQLDFHQEGDAEFTVVPMGSNSSKDKSPQIQGELRAHSPILDGFLGLGIPLGTSEVTLGLFFQERKIVDSVFTFNISLPDLGVLLVASGVPNAGLVSQTPLLPTIYPPLEGLPTEVAIALIREQVTGVENTTMFFEQTARSYAGFGQFTWNFFPRWSLDLGSRLTFEEKSASLHRVNSPNAVAFPILSQRPFQANLNIDELAFTPKGALRFDWTDEIGFYASWARGFKAGGFNEPASNDDDIGELTFDPEIATAWEVGTKARFLGGAATANMTLFRQEVDDIQIFNIDPDVSFNVRNAGGATAQGVELDAGLLPTSWLTLRGVLGFNDMEFTEFFDGTCPFDNLNRDGDENPRCDLSGQPPPRTPKWQTNLAALIRVPVRSLPGLSSLPVPDALAVRAGGSVEYSDVHFTAEAPEPRSRQDAFLRYNADFGFEDPAMGWSFWVTGQNLTNEIVQSVTRDISVAGGSYFFIPQDPRTIFATFRWEY